MVHSEYLYGFGAAYKRGFWKIVETLESPSGYVDANSDSKGQTHVFQNYAFQLQTSEGKAVYDLYLQERARRVQYTGSEKMGYLRPDYGDFGTAQGYSALGLCVIASRSDGCNSGRGVRNRFPRGATLWLRSVTLKPRKTAFAQLR